MTLRTKFLALFLCLGVLPLLALGLLNYVQSTRALEDLLAARAKATASRAAEALSHRYSLATADLHFLAENAESQRLLRGRERSGETLSDSSRRVAESFLDEAWGTIGPVWKWVEIRDSAGALVYELGSPDRGVAPSQGVGPAGLADEYLVTRSIRYDADRTEVELGVIVGSLPVQEVLPLAELAAGFGEAGYSVIIDRDRGELVFHPRSPVRQHSVSSLFGPGGWDVDPDLLALSEGRFSFAEEGVKRVASFEGLEDPPWTVISSESLEEFVAPFARSGSFNLLIVLLVTATILVASVLLTRQATESLVRLTGAADEVARGNLEPVLPPGGTDEVGRLSAAFSTMVGQVRAMLRRVEESRHMSAIGEFTSQLSHEIRNPLTSIKLNLQRLERGVEDSRIPQEYAKAVHLCLREVKRLDGTVRGVLSIARTRPPRQEPVSLHSIVREMVETLSPQMKDQGIEVRVKLDAPADEVLGDQEQLTGAFLNLFLNATEAMNEGGRLRITTGALDGVGGDGKESAWMTDVTGPAIRVEIQDEGSGVPQESRDRIFDPFFSTKKDGTGFGLPLALRVMEEHGGTLALLEPDTSRRGATFEILLPLAPEGGR